MPRHNHRHEPLPTDRLRGWHIRVNGSRIVLASWPCAGDSPDHAEVGAGDQCEDCGEPDTAFVWDGNNFKCACGAKYGIKPGGFLEVAPEPEPESGDDGPEVFTHPREDGRVAFYMRDRLALPRYAR